MNNILTKLPRSSADSTKASLTYEGVLAILFSLLVLVARQAGVDIGITFPELVHFATEIVAVIGVIWGGLATVYGGGRRLWNKIKKTK